jgi:hypothetical protein
MKADVSLTAKKITITNREKIEEILMKNHKVKILISSIKL